MVHKISYYVDTMIMKEYNAVYSTNIVFQKYTARITVLCVKDDKYNGVCCHCGEVRKPCTLVKHFLSNNPGGFYCVNWQIATCLDASLL